MPSETLCPRCGGTFHCGAKDATPCPCSTLTLAASTLAALRAQYNGCLCLACLAQLQSNANIVAEETTRGLST
jgi:hypothetical protein